MQYGQTPFCLDLKLKQYYGRTGDSDLDVTSYRFLNDEVVTWHVTLDREMVETI